METIGVARGGRHANARASERRAGQRRQETVQAHRRAVERVIGEMRQRLYDGFSLEEMAEVGVMSPYHFNRVFRQTTGLPPVQFFGSLRLESAKRLLLDSTMSVTDVCFEVGYNSLGTFTRRFGELVGVPPRRFRELFAEDDGGPALDVLRRPQGLPSLDGGISQVVGRVVAPEGASGPVFVGAFAADLPQARPQSCAVLVQPGPFRLRTLPDGRYRVFATSLAWSSGRRDLMLCQQALRGATERPIVVRRGRLAGGGEIEIRLRPPQPVDPPLLMTLPLLLRERAEAWGRQAAMAR